MEEGSPIFESFTQSVADGPSQPLMRKLVSLMADPSPAMVDRPAANGFLLVDPPQSSSSRLLGALDGVVEDIAQAVELENAVQSGFRFAGSDGCCNVSPRVENYFSDSQESGIPADLADKVPIDFLHAINNVLVPMPTAAAIPHHDHDHGHHHVHHHGRRHGHGRRRHGKRTGPPPLSLKHKEPLEPSAAKEEEEGGAATAATSRDCRYAQEMVTRRLDRLEEICLRTESYVQMVLGTMDRRLQLLEGDVIARCTKDSLTSPRFPGIGLSSEAGTFVTPEMLMLQSPRPDRMSLAASVVPATSALEVSHCQAFEDPEATSFIIPVPSVSEQFANAFSTSAEDRPEVEAGRDENAQVMAPSTPDVVEETTTTYRQQEERTSERPLVAAIAVFSLTPDTPVPPSEVSPVDARLNEPVVTWENEGFPYLRPAYQVEFEPRPRDTTVLTWDAAPYMALESASSEGDRATECSENAFAFCNVEEPRQFEEESRMLSEVSTILQNICIELEACSVPECTDTESCPHCGSRRSSPADQDEIVSVLEEMFTRLSYHPRSEDVLVSIDASGAPWTKHNATAEDTLSAADSSKTEKQNFDIFPLQADNIPMVKLSFTQEGSASANISQATSMGPALSQHDALNLHVAISPKEIRVQEPKVEDETSSVIQQDIRFAVEGPYSEPVIREADVEVKQLEQDPVTVTTDNLQLSDDVVAEYTLKVVPRPELQSTGRVPTVASTETNILVNEEEVGSVIHELCFALDVPATQEDKSKEQELPLQIAIALSGNSEPGVVTPMLLGGKPSSSEVSSSTQPEKEIASIVVDLEPLQIADEMQDIAFNWEGLPASGECEDIPCVLSGEDRKVAGEDRITTVRQDVRICLEVPTKTSDEAASSGVQIGIGVKSVPKDQEDYTVMSVVEIPEDRQFEKVSLSSVAAAERPVEPASEELAPLTATGVEHVEQQVEPASEELAPLTTTAPEAVEPGSEELAPLTAKAPEAVRITSLGDELLVEAMVVPPPSPSETAPDADIFVVDEEKKTEEEWVIDSSFLPKEHPQKVGPKVPKTVLKGVTARDLIRGSLHFDGKTCLLSVSMDDIWTVEDMCQAPVPASKDKSVHRSGDKSCSSRNEFLIREIPAWLGDVLIDEIRPSSEKTFGFKGGLIKQRQQQPQQLQSENLQQHHQSQREVFGFRSSPGRQAKPVSQKPRPGPVFGFRSLPPKSGRPPIPPAKPNISVTIPVSNDECDSSLSLVNRERSPLSQQEQTDPSKPRVPDSPGARSCIINKASEPESSGNGASTLVVEPGFEQDAQAPPKALISDAASASTPLQTTPTSTLLLAQTSSLPPPGKTGSDLVGSGAEEPSAEAPEASWSSDGLHVLPVDALQEETFFDALECAVGTGRNSAGSNSRIKRYLKDKLWNKFSCYGTGLPETESSDTSVRCSQ